MPAGVANDSDIRAEAVNLPLEAAAGVGFSQTQDIVKFEINHHVNNQKPRKNAGRFAWLLYSVSRLFCEVAVDLVSELQRCCSGGLSKVLPA